MTKEEFEKELKKGQKENEKLMENIDKLSKEFDAKVKKIISVL